MLKKEMIKPEIERELYGKGDYVQIDSLRRFLRENVPNDIRRFTSMKLVGIYEKRSMFAEAAVLYSKLAEIAPDYAERMNCLLKETENYVKAGFFDGACMAINRLIAEVKPMEKSKITNSIKEFYNSQAKLYEKERRRSKAVGIYEKLLEMKSLSDAEKSEINGKLTQAYKELGMVQKYLGMKEKIN